MKEKILLLEWGRGLNLPSKGGKGGGGLPESTLSTSKIGGVRIEIANKVDRTGQSPFRGKTD